MDAVAFCHLRRLGLTVQIVRRRHRGIARSPSARLPEMSSRAVRNRRELGRWPQNHPRSEQCEDLTRFPGTRNPKFEGRNPKADKEGAITKIMSAAIRRGALGVDLNERAWALEAAHASGCFVGIRFVALDCRFRNWTVTGHLRAVLRAHGESCERTMQWWNRFLCMPPTAATR